LHYGIFGDATTKELAKLVSDSALEVRRVVILALGKFANWRYEPAQRA
jgi:hypothetical protein